MYKIKARQNKGITLITLMLTVIILLILTTVAVDIAFDNGFFDKAQNIVNKANEQIINKEDQEENAINTWEQIPGSIVKSRTSI